MQGLVAAECAAGVDAWVWAICGGEPWVEGVRLLDCSDCSDCSIVRLKQFDLVHIHGIWSWKLHRVAVMCRKAGVKYVIAPRGMLEPWSLQQKWLKKRIARWLYQDRDLKLAAALHATAESEAEQFRKLGFKNKIIVSPNGVNVPDGKLFDCSDCSIVRMDGQRRALAERKVEEWLEGVTRESFGAALEKMIENNLASGIIQLRNANERGLIRDAALEFFDGFANRIVVLSDGRCVYFAPDQRSKKRGLDNSSAWAEYAIHATTNGGVLASGQKYHVRWFNPVKPSNFDLIEATLKKENCAPGIKKNPIADSIDFFGETHDGGKFVVIVRLDEYGNANANMTEVTFEASRSSKKKPPRLKPLAEAVEAVVHHQAAGTNPSTDNTIAKSAELRKGGRHRALFVSRMHPKKGVLELVESWARVFKKEKVKSKSEKVWTCELVYTMNSEEERAYEQKVKQRVHELGMTYVDAASCRVGRDEDVASTDFIFTGPLDDEKKWEAYARADLFVLPTYSENFGIVVAEALWAGVPVITTKGTPWVELECSASSKFQVSSSRLEERCGWWIDLPPAEVNVKGVGAEWNALDKALREAFEQSNNPNNRTILQDMGRRGHELVESKYTWSAVVKAMVDGYERIA